MIVYNNDTGFTYLEYLRAVFLLLCDIVLNRAAITSYILNSIGQ